MQLAHSRGDYPEAVRLFLVCLENMKACSPLAIVNELASILQETYQKKQNSERRKKKKKEEKKKEEHLKETEFDYHRYTQIQARLDKALVECCHSFNPQTYL